MKHKGTSRCALHPFLVTILLSDTPFSVWNHKPRWNPPTFPITFNPPFIPPPPSLKDPSNVILAVHYAGGLIPDRALTTAQVSVNKHAWSKVANVIYLDSPAGVGLSYSNTPRDYVTNDTATAVDTNTFLRRFFEEYPEFLRNDLYIAGTSNACILAKHN